MKFIKEYIKFNSDSLNPFYIFGSEDSQDYDVIVSVDDIPQNVEEASNMCKYWDEKLSLILSDKPLNCNLGIFKGGKLTKVYKGTVDELVNCIYYTYDNHIQYYPNPIESPVDRNIEEKILRVSRFLITFYSRTHLRTEIKSALRGNLKLKLNVLKKLDFTEMTEFPGKKEKLEDIYKVIAFQFGQIFSLIDGYESDSYTKSGIAKNYPDLSNFLLRKSISNTNLLTLNSYLNRFIDLIDSQIDTIKLTEK